MTPQQLIDLPGYGSAKRELIKQGQWQATMTDTERIEWLAFNVATMHRNYDVDAWTFEIASADYDPDHMRDDIDARAAALANQGTHHAPKR